MDITRYEYNVKSGALKPVTAFNNGGYGYVFEYTTLRYGVDGSYWFGANRADGSDGVEGNGKTKEPNLGHVKLDGTTADNTNHNDRRPSPALRTDADEQQGGKSCGHRAFDRRNPDHGVKPGYRCGYAGRYRTPLW